MVVLELGSCSIRGGVLTTEPSLPQSFFPAIAVRTDDGRIVVGEDAYAPEVCSETSLIFCSQLTTRNQIRHHGEFVRPIQAQDPVVERYTMDQEVVRACVQKVIKDLHVNPSQYKVRFFGIHVLCISYFILNSADPFINPSKHPNCSDRTTSDSCLERRRIPGKHPGLSITRDSDVLCGLVRDLQKRF